MQKLIIAPTLLLSSLVMATNYQPHQEIRQTAADYVLANADMFPVSPQVTAGNLDSRLLLTECSQALEAYETQGGLKAGRGVVGVRCRGTKPWKIFVTVNTALPAEVVVARHPIQRGDIIGKDDLMLERKDLAKLHKDYYQDSSTLIGQKARRRLSRGAVITPSSTEAVKMVKRGADVQILAMSPKFRIRMKGKALGSGGLGDTIKVKNKSSGRELTGMIIAAGTVRVTR